MSLTLQVGPGSAPPKPPRCRGINGNSFTWRTSCEPKAETGQRASGILSYVVDPMAGDTTPSPAKGGIGMEAPHSGGGRIKRTRPSPVTPSLSRSLLPLPHRHSLSLYWLPPLRNPAARVCRAPRPGRSGWAGEGGADRGWVGPEPQPATSWGFTWSRAVPCRALSFPALSSPLLSSPVLPRSISSFSIKTSYKCTATVQQLQPRRAEPCPAPLG